MSGYLSLSQFRLLMSNCNIISTTCESEVLSPKFTSLGAWFGMIKSHSKIVLLKILSAARLTVILKEQGLKVVFRYLNVSCYTEEALLLFDSEKQDLGQWVKVIGMPI